MTMIIDVHGHYTTAPAALGAWRDLQIAALKDPSQAPKASDLKISDDEIRETIETNQLRLMKERGSDLTIFSPRASFMAHHIGDFQTSSTWAAKSPSVSANGARPCWQGDRAQPSCARRRPAQSSRGGGGRVSDKTRKPGQPARSGRMDRGSPA